MRGRREGNYGGFIPELEVVTLGGGGGGGESEHTEGISSEWEVSVREVGEGEDGVRKMRKKKKRGGSIGVNWTFLFFPKKVIQSEQIYQKE